VAVAERVDSGCRSFFVKGAVFDVFPARIFAVISSDPCTYKFTIGKRTDLQYAFACYLEQPSPTARATPAVTLDRSYCCKLFVVTKKVNSFAIKQIQTLLPKHPGWGIPPNPAPVESATYSLFFRGPVII
jgi:hypothetical protein